jgi:signal transduction histidine kinase
MKMLTRVRVGFAALAVVLIVQLTAVILRSLATLDRERDLRHAAVASRVFDEAERALGELLREEQARSVSDYLPVGQDGSPSPLAAAPRSPFVLGYFQIDRSGRLATPSADTAIAAELRKLVGSLGPGRLEPRAQSAPAPQRKVKREEVQQEPGTTRSSAKLDLFNRQRAVASSEAELSTSDSAPAAAPPTSYEVLAELGRVAQSNTRAAEPTAARAPAPRATAVDEAQSSASRRSAAPAPGAVALEAPPEALAIAQETPPSDAPATMAQPSASARSEVGPVAVITRRERSDAFGTGLDGAVADASSPPDETFAQSELREAARRRAERQGPERQEGAGLEAARSGSLAPTSEGNAPGPIAPSRPPRPARDRTGGGGASPDFAALEEEADARDRTEDRSASERDSASRDESASAEQSFGESARAGRSAGTLATAPLGELLDIAPSRLSGEPLGDGRIVLYRTAVLPDGLPCRQGLLVDLARLGEWLEARVLGESELRSALDLSFPPPSAPGGAPLPEDRFVYMHRFAEPFDALYARLAVLPLYDSGSGRDIWQMAALLAIASTLALLAAYRTASVAVHFAERRSSFAAAVSHELKTPLTAIRMYGEMLRDGMVPDPTRRAEYYATITSESERLTRLINNVLEWSKLEKHQRELATVRGRIEPSVDEVVRVVEPHAHALGVALERHIDPDLPPVAHDPDAVQQILFNLIDNALKYARGSEPARIDVACARTSDGVAVRVRDHGPGVNAKSLPLIFDAFYRAGDELTRRTQGTGIGLALVRGLADAMGAKVAARNHPDGGLEVELRLRA